MTIFKRSDRQIAVLAYGSLLAHPGAWIGERMQKLIRWETPFHVEYLGSSERRGGAPTLVPCGTKYSRVRGGLIVLALKPGESLDDVKIALAIRGGLAENSPRIKAEDNVLGFLAVYIDLSDKKQVREDPNDFARRAIESVGKCVAQGTPFMNGIRYLRDNLEWDVHTQLSEKYRQAILDQTSTKTLEEAENQALAKMGLKL